MVEALAGLLTNNVDVDRETITTLFEKYEDLMQTMKKVDPLSVDADVRQKCLDKITKVTKSFVDAGVEPFKKCSPFTAYIAWGSQFVLLCEHSSNEDLIQKKITSLEKEMDQKQFKKTIIENVLANIKDENFIAILDRELQEDADRLS